MTYGVISAGTRGAYGGRSLRYRQQYGTSDWACTAPQDITTATTIPVSLFNGQSARGAVHVRHTLYGGTYPTTGGSVQDTVTVNYSY
ncbi:hypothetical protein [Polymorphospora sp. A560]|uniref:hypothetical protein n=1 Tax=Polymorphospora sp. A560 TaxID=3040203 RepID=UPI0038915B29